MRVSIVTIHARPSRAAKASSLEGSVDYPPLLARVIDGAVSTSGETWIMKCPSGAAPIGMYVYRNDKGRPSGLSVLCVRPD